MQKKKKKTWFSLFKSNFTYMYKYKCILFLVYHNVNWKKEIFQMSRVDKNKK